MPSLSLRLLPPVVWLAHTCCSRLNRTAALFVVALLSLCLASPHAWANNTPTISVASSPLSLSSGPNTTNTITVTYHDGDGVSDLNDGWLLLNNEFTSTRGIAMRYNAPLNKLYLYNDSATTWLGAATPGTATVISNSFGSLDCGATTVTRTTTDITVAYSVKVFSPLDGQNMVWSYINDLSGGASPVPFTSFGTWTVSGQSPQIVAPSPTYALNTAVGNERSLVVTLRDPDGAFSIKSAQVLINDRLAGADAMYIYYIPLANQIYFRQSNDSAWLGPVTLGTTGTLSTIQGSLDTGRSTATFSGTDLTLDLKLTPGSSLAGANNIYAYAADRGNRTAGFTSIGTWQVASSSMTITGSAGNASTTLNWSSVSGATGYNVIRSMTSGKNYTLLTSTALGSGATSYTDSTPSNGTTYYYCVYPTLSSGRGPDSNELALKPLAAPSAPTGLTVTPHSNEVLLSWNGVTGATGYKIYRTTTSGVYSTSPLTTVGAVTTYTDTTALNDTTYYYEVSAINVNNTEGPKSSESSAVTPNPFDAITLTGQAGDGEVSLGWTPAGGATSYQIYQDAGSGPTPIATVIPTSNSDNHYTKNGLTNSASYVYSVVGLNGGVIVTNPSNNLTLTPVAGGLGGYGGYYDGVSDVTWTWSDNTNTDLRLSGSGQLHYGLPGAGPESVNYAQRGGTAIGIGYVSFYYSENSTRKQINWSWKTDNQALHPAPSVDVTYGFPYILSGNTYSSGNAGGSLLMVFNHYINGTSAGYFEENGVTSYNDIGGITTSGGTSRGNFSTDEGLGVRGDFTVSSLDSSSSAVASYSANTRLELFLLNPQP